MASKKGKILAGAAALILAGAGGGWYVVTGNIVKNAAAWVAEVGSKKLADGSSYALTYDSLTRSSFPSIGVRVVNPVYTLTATGDDTETKPPVTFTIKLNGAVDTTTDYLTNAYRVAIDGAYTMDASIGEQKLSAKSATPSSERWMLKARDRKMFSAWNRLDWKNNEQVKAAMQGIAAISYNVGAFALNDANGKLLLGGEKLAFGFTNRSSQGFIDGDVAIEAKALESSEAYNQTAEALMQALNAPMPLKLGDMPFSASRAGKQDMDVAISAKLPMGMARGAEPNGTIHISKLHLKNDFYTFNAPMNMVLAEANGQRNLTLKLDWMLEASAAGGAEVQRLVDMAIGFAPTAGASPEDTALLKQKITAALPTLSTLGPITLAIDLDATSPVSAAPAADAAKAPAGKDSVTLRNFALTHKRWGLEAKGESLNDANGANINVNLLCKQCDSLTSDAFSTAQAAQEAMNVATPNRPQMALTPEFLTQVNSTLAEIGSKNAAGDISFAFTTPKAGEVVVNGKPLAEVGPKLMALFMALQPAPAAPAGEEAPAE